MEISCEETSNTVVTGSDLSNQSNNVKAQVEEEHVRFDDDYNRKSGRYRFLSFLSCHVLSMLHGVGISITQLTEITSYAYVCNLSDPSIALQSTLYMNLLTSIFQCSRTSTKSKSYLISGSTASIAFILSKLVRTHGESYIYCTMICAGLFQVLIGVTGFANFLFKMISYPVKTAYLSCIGVVLALLQFNYFQLSRNNEIFTSTSFIKAILFTSNENWVNLITFVIMLFEALGAALICIFLPQTSKKIPMIFLAILIMMAFEWGCIRSLGYETPLIQDLYPLQRTLPTTMFRAKLAPFSWNTIQIIFPYSLLVCLSSSIDTYQGASFVSTTIAPMNYKHLIITQGFSKIISSLLGGGLGGSIMISQSFLNKISSSSSSLFSSYPNLSSIYASISLFCIMTFAYPVINIIPLASVVGIMIFCSFYLIQWNIIAWSISTFSRQKLLLKKIIDHQIRFPEYCIVVLVMTCCFTLGLGIGVCVGILLSLLDFTYQVQQRIKIQRNVEEQQNQNAIYHLTGPVYFGSTQILLQKILSTEQNQNEEGIIISLEGAEIFDHSGLIALYDLTEQLKNTLGKTVAFSDVNETSRVMMQKTSSLWERVYFLEYKDLEYNQVS